MEPQKFYDQFVGKLIRDFLLGNRRIEAAITFALGYLMRTQPGRILDLGCGIGWSTYEFSRGCPQSVVHGLDLSPQLIAVARAMFSRPGRCDFFEGDLTAADWRGDRPGRYQACVMLDVYEHIPRKSREGFHESLRAVLDEEAMVILTCPTPLHQRYLRESRPEGLQPVDEDVLLADLARLAADLSAEIVHYEFKGIWQQNDYFHAVLQRKVKLREKVTQVTPPALLPRRQRWRYAKAAAHLYDPAVLRQSRSGRASFIRRIKRALHWLND